MPRRKKNMTYAEEMVFLDNEIAKTEETLKQLKARRKELDKIRKISKRFTMRLKDPEKRSRRLSPLFDIRTIFVEMHQKRQERNGSCFF